MLNFLKSGIKSPVFQALTEVALDTHVIVGSGTLSCVLCSGIKGTFSFPGLLSTP